MNYGKTWKEARSKALLRDGFACVACGADFDGERLVVHHIIPIDRFGGDTENANELSNLVSLCTVCHGGLHMLMDAIDEGVKSYWQRGHGVALTRDRRLFKVLTKYIEAV